MKKKLLIVMLSMSITSFACDICGGVASNVSIGVLANTNFHIVGVRNTYRSYSSYINDIKHATDRLFSQELFLRYQWNKNWQLYGSFQHQLAFQQRDLGSEFVRGLTDPSLLLNRLLINKQDSTGRTIDFLMVGAGLKFPLGKNAPSSNLLKNLYPGTGSFDMLLLANYTHQLTKKMGVQVETSYTLKGKDKWGYSYGNSFQGTVSFVHSQPVQSYRLVSAFGIVTEDFQSSKINGIELVTASNRATILSGKLNLNLFTNKWVWSVFVQYPLAQQNQEILIKRNLSGGIGLLYLIKKRKK
jgi:hypothetical protein